MEDELVHIEVYVKDITQINKIKVGYECVDNDKAILFSPHIFEECLGEWGRDTGNIIVYTIEDLRHNLDVFTAKVVVLPDIVSKIENIIKFIEKNKIFTRVAQLFIEQKKKPPKSQRFISYFLNKYIDRARPRPQPSQSIRKSQRCVSNTLLERHCRKHTAHTHKCWIHLAKQNNLQIKPSNVIGGGEGLFAWKNTIVRLYQNTQVGKEPKRKLIESMGMVVPITRYAIAEGIVLMQITQPMPLHVLLTALMVHTFIIMRN
jgi:hypothetical protein